MTSNVDTCPKVAVVIPCYRGKSTILDVLKKIPEVVTKVYCVDDGCPDGTGKYVQTEMQDKRIIVLFNVKNEGVGGAMSLGYKTALQDEMDFVIKVDCDGQMDPRLIPRFLKPLLSGSVDYVKGNRFYRREAVRSMPPVRLFGNAVLSFVSKFSTGYWNIFDPNNGFTAINSKVLNMIPLEKISKDYFFESDMLFRLNTIRAVVIDMPMDAEYGNEMSNLSINRNVPIFIYKHIRNFVKRIGYNYFLRDFSVASLEWILGPILLAFGFTFGSYKWLYSIQNNVVATAGTVMLAALTVIVGLQLLLSALHYDVENVPTIPLSSLLNNRDLH